MLLEVPGDAPHPEVATDHRRIEHFRVRARLLTTGPVDAKGLRPSYGWSILATEQFRRHRRRLRRDGDVHRRSHNLVCPRRAIRRSLIADKEELPPERYAEFW